MPEISPEEKIEAQIRRAERRDRVNRASLPQSAPKQTRIPTILSVDPVIPAHPEAIPHRPDERDIHLSSLKVKHRR